MALSVAESADRLAIDPGGTLIGLDFDGTLSHMVDDPAHAFAHPEAVAALQRLGRVVGQLAVITGRPARQALELGGFEGLAGLERLVICGQYGAERWDALTGEVVQPPRPEAVDRVAELLPGWLAERGAERARIEDKGLAVAVHTRGVAPGLIRELEGPLRELAAEHDLVVEPGRQVIELRTHGTDKGEALLALVHEVGARHVIYAGDDLGDLPAFAAVEHLRTEGVDGQLICSESTEEDALVVRSDLVLEGPDQIAAWLTELADAVER